MAEGLLSSILMKKRALTLNKRAKLMSEKRGKKGDKVKKKKKKKVDKRRARSRERGKMGKNIFKKTHVVRAASNSFSTGRSPAGVRGMSSRWGQEREREREREREKEDGEREKEGE